MPEGSSSGIKKVSYNGAGEYEFGTFELNAVGTYVYQMSEDNTGTAGYTYDTSTYTVTYEVKDEGGSLVATRTITKDGKTVEKTIFTNTYSEPKKQKQNKQV